MATIFTLLKELTARNWVNVAKLTGFPRPHLISVKPVSQQLSEIINREGEREYIRYISAIKKPIDAA